MDRTMFERIRDLDSKRIEVDIALLRREPSGAVHVALGIPISNPLGVVPRSELSGLDVRSLFLQFCREARIRFDGRILIGH